MKINKEIFDRIDSIHWFTNCGTPIAQGSIKQSIVLIDGWVQAEKWYSATSWEHTTLEARNTLTEFLHRKYPNQDAEWNKKVEDAKGYIDSSLSAKLHSYKDQYQLDHIFVDCVKWDVLHAIMEFAYTDCKRLPHFFLDLLQIYENGHFPCGWEGDYPNGKLVVY
ncbi:hypothetical protein [Paenibacillus sp. FSL H8-0079]|uniref:hypothetical protein n=1 Tax=Paenibacillus sp. FSL H8-0079 TaxID=2921375 RepID=UPI0030EC1031